MTTIGMNGASLTRSSIPFFLMTSLAMCGAFGISLVLTRLLPERPGRAGTDLPSAARRLAARFWAEVARHRLVQQASLCLQSGLLCNRLDADCNIVVNDRAVEMRRGLMTMCGLALTTTTNN